MANKHLSVIIVPHTKTSTKTLCFSQKTLKILAIGGIVLGSGPHGRARRLRPDERHQGPV